MSKKLRTLCCFLVMFVSAGIGFCGESLHYEYPSESAAVMSIPPQLPEYEDSFFKMSPRAILTDKEKKAVAISRDWQEQAISQVSPMRAPAGAIQFVFGLEQPSIICAPFNVTDIELQRGEVIEALVIGDTARWKVETIVSGGDTQHVILKPLDVGLTTSMAIATNRRTYHMRLKSTHDDYMTRIIFAYQDDMSLKIAEQKRAIEAKREQETIPETREYIHDLNFNYAISGKAFWKPVRVYNNGEKTVLEMPVLMTQMEAPSLLVLQQGKETLVNYRVHDKRYIVDQIFEQAVLIAGVGRKQERVTIKYLGLPKKR